RGRRGVAAATRRGRVRAVRAAADVAAVQHGGTGVARRKRVIAGARAGVCRHDVQVIRGAESVLGLLDGLTGVRAAIVPLGAADAVVPDYVAGPTAAAIRIPRLDVVADDRVRDQVVLDGVVVRALVDAVHEVPREDDPLAVAVDHVPRDNRAV